MGSNERRRRRTWRQLFYIVLFLGALIGGYLAFDHYVESRDRVRVVFELPSGSQTPPFELEIAANEAARVKGLMFRKREEMPERGGMIFVYPEMRMNRFWMKDTPLPLDMIFLDEKNVVLGVVADARPYSLDPHGIDVPSRHVIELHGGSAARYGIASGAKAKLSRDVMGELGR